MEEHLLTKVFPDSKLDFIQYNTKIQQVTLELTVLDYDMLGGSDAIGKVIFIYSFLGSLAPFNDVWGTSELIYSFSHLR